MISIEDCLALCELTEDEVAAIAEHEHLPTIEAAALGQYLVHQPGGLPKIQRFIVDDIKAARARGDFAHIVQLRHALQKFLADHPNAKPA